MIASHTGVTFNTDKVKTQLELEYVNHIQCLLLLFVNCRTAVNINKLSTLAKYSLKLSQLISLEGN